MASRPPSIYQRKRMRQRDVKQEAGSDKDRRKSEQIKKKGSSYDTLSAPPGPTLGLNSACRVAHSPHLASFRPCDVMGITGICKLSPCASQCTVYMCAELHTRAIQTHVPTQIQTPTEVQKHKYTHALTYINTSHTYSSSLFLP